MIIGYRNIILCFVSLLSAAHLVTTKALASEKKIQLLKEHNTYNSIIIKAADKKTIIPLIVYRGEPVTQKSDFMAPRFSPDGKHILLTKGKYCGLYILTRKKAKMFPITDTCGYGYHARWSHDSMYIITSKNSKKVVFNLLGKMVPSQKVIAAPEAEVYAKNDLIFLKTKDLNKSITLSDTNDRYYAPLISPDKQKVAYLGISTGIYIRNLVSGKTTFIGRGTEIRWTADSNALVYTQSRDDGHTITKSDIFYAKADGSLIVNLTNTPGIHESHPDLAPDGSALAYEVKGQIFIAEIKYP